MSFYTLDENGKTAGELSPSDTIYGEIPAGCSELFNGILPYYTEQFGYMPVQNETCLGDCGCGRQPSEGRFRILRIHRRCCLRRTHSLPCFGMAMEIRGVTAMRSLTRKTDALYETAENIGT
ncbi:MAG: hypothetical protein ACLR8P_02205 [Clostridium fessum]